MGAASRGTLPDFIEAIQARPDIDWRKYFSKALRNEDLKARIAIANWMLDNGADPTVVDEEKSNCLHTFFYQRTHDIIGEAALLQRILDAGTDINLKSPRYGAPIEIFIHNSSFPDATNAPFYDVIFSTPGIDFTIQVAPAATLKESIQHLNKALPELNRRMTNYLTNGPSPRPQFTT